MNEKIIFKWNREMIEYVGKYSWKSKKVKGKTIHSPNSTKIWRGYWRCSKNEIFLPKYNIKMLFNNECNYFLLLLLVLYGSYQLSQH